MLSSVSEITTDKEAFEVTFSIEEGEQYAYGTVEVASELKDVDIGEIQKVITTVPDVTFNASQVDDSDAITQALNDKGYAFVEVSPKFVSNDEAQLLNITYTIKEGPKVYIDRIDIVGNVRTLDKVIRQNSVFQKDPYNAAMIRRSQQRIENLGFLTR